MAVDPRSGQASQLTQAANRQSGFSLLLAFSRLGSRLGIASSMVLLGALHEEGQAGDGTIETANELYRQAARKGNAQAMWRLGVNHLSSKDGVDDLQQAVFWIKQAVDAGDAMAAWALGKMYLAGHPLEQDIPAGMLLLQQSAAEGYAPACLALAETYQQGRDGVAIDVESARYWLIQSRPVLQRLMIRLGLARIENLT